MKENVIFCYSGTGNCLDMAKNIAASLGDTDIVMMRKYPAVTDVRGAKRVGFIFPCYGGGLPGHVERYLHDIKVDPDAYTFGIQQCSAYAGEGLRKLNELIPLKYWAKVTHQCTCIWLFPHELMMPMLPKEQAQERSEKLAAKLAEDIKECKESKRGVPKAYANTAEHALWPQIARKQGLSLKANDDCILCGQCAKLCPTGNIRYQGKAVIFGDKCISCCGCVQYCPQEAIDFGNITKGRERYHNANITPEDLSQDIISF